MSRLGVFLRKLRIEHGEVLMDMAQKLHVSSAFLSAVETDRKSAPLTWVDVIAEEYDLNAKQRAELREGVNESIKQVRLDVGESPANRRDCALAFARRFDSLSDQDVQMLMELLEKRRN